MLLSALVFLGASEVRASDCDRFRPLSELTAEMRQTTVGSSSPDSLSKSRVEQLVKNISLPEIERDLTRLNLVYYYPRIAQLVSQANEYTHSGKVSVWSEMLDNTRSIDGLISRLCDRERNDRLGPEGNFSGNTRALGDFFAEQTTWVRASAFTVGAVLFLALIVGLLTLVRIGVGLIQHKKTCLIPAQLIGNGQIFSGKLSRAGLHAVRFEPSSEAVAKQLTDLMGSPAFVHFDLEVNEVVRPVFVDGYHTFYAPLYFFSKLSRPELSALLALSQRRVRNAPYIGHRSTRKKWRAQIKERNRLIKLSAPAR